MSDQLITVGEAANALGVTSSLPSNKCLTKGEFDELLYGSGWYDPASAPIGIYIVDTNGKVYPRAKWNTSENANAVGIGVKTSNCSFVIAPEERNTIQWGGYGTLISGCPTTIDSSVATNDYKGKANTDAIISTLGVYTAMAANLLMNNIVTEATEEAATTPSTMSENGATSVLTDEEYQTLLAKDEQTLTDEEKQQISEYRTLQIKSTFKEQYNISSDVVLGLVLSKMRIQIKEMIATQSQVMMLPADEDTTNALPVTETDVDNISDEGIMLLAATASQEYAANYCRNYAFKNGKQGYLPAEGELYEAYQNKAEIDACMSLIGGYPLYDSSVNNYWKWSSTQSSANDAWGLYWDDFDVDTTTKDYSANFVCARPFTAFQ